MTKKNIDAIDFKTSVVIRSLGLVAYEPVYHSMQAFTQTRHANTLDELWLLQHQPVYTLGQAGRREHLLNTAEIPVYATDRGGQVTYHGPGQLVVYLLMDLKRRHWGVKQLVTALEQAVINYLRGHHLVGERLLHAPGVYVAGAKIAALGLRVQRGCSYHGLSLNVDMDLTPFSGIHPCGYSTLKVTQLRHLGIQDHFDQVSQHFLAHLLAVLGYSECF